MFRKHLLATWVFLIATVYGTGAAAVSSGVPVKFQRLMLDDGLSQSSILSIHQDSRGFIWMGTQDGFNRYDGRNFVSYKADPDDPHSVSDPNIWAIAEDPDGNLWVGTEGGGFNPFDPSAGAGALWTWVIFFLALFLIMLLLALTALWLIWRLVVRRKIAPEKEVTAAPLSKDDIEARLREAEAVGVDVGEAGQGRHHVVAAPREVELHQLHREEDEGEEQGELGGRGQAEGVAEGDLAGGGGLIVSGDSVVCLGGLLNKIAAAGESKKGDAEQSLEVAGSLPGLPGDPHVPAAAARAAEGEA